MRLQDKKRFIIANVIYIALALVFVFSIYKNERQKSVELPAPPNSPIYTNTSTPARVKISAIGVDAEVEAVGIAKSGNMAVPREFENVGWYKHGALPGGVGNVVIAGHLDTGRGKPAVFYRLDELDVGNQIVVVGSGGEEYKYKIISKRIVDYSNPGADILEDIFGKTESAKIHLITCDGTWIAEKKSYSERLIISGELVGKPAS